MKKRSIARILSASTALTLFLGLTNPATTRAADLITYLLSKGSNYVQSSSAVVVANSTNPVTAMANVYLTAVGAGTTAAIGPAGTLISALTVQTNLQNLQLQYLAPFADRATMDLQFPDGSYSLQISTVHDGVLNLVMSVTGDSYPSPPQISNFDLAQIINPTADFILSWNPFLNASGNDFIYWEVRELPGGGGATLVARSPLPNETGTISGSAVQAAIPAGSLQPNHAYALQVWFYRLPFQYTSDVNGYSGYAAATTLTIQTVGNNGAPAFTLSPTNLTLNAGATAVFYSSAGGASPIYYQWQLGGVNVTDATNATLTLLDVQTNQAGTYTVIATNAAGSVVSSPATLTVIPANPLAFAQGSYSGLFFSTNGVTEQSSGYFTASVTTKLTYSAKLQWGGKTYSCSGQIGADGKATNAIPPKGATLLTVELQVDTGGGDQLIGAVRGQGWTADLLAYQAQYNAKTNPPARFGKYTLVFPGTNDPVSGPSGYSFGTVTIAQSGKVSLSGVLSDGTKITQSTTLSTNGQWPLFSSLYSHQGSVLSWIALANSDVSDFAGALTWIKPAQPKTKTYPSGFQLSVPVAGSLYLAPSKGTAVLDFTNGIVSFSLTNAGPNLTNQITLTPNNKVVNGSPNKLSFSMSLGTGLFSGKVTDPATDKPVAFRGALLQRQNDGFGFFLNPSLSGPVFFGD